MKMLETADVLIENFKPGTLDKWGIGYDVLRAKFPRLVHCRISGFGDDGPLGGYPGYDAMIQAMTGMIAVTGSPRERPDAHRRAAGRSLDRPLRRDRHPDGARNATAPATASSSTPRSTRPGSRPCIRTPELFHAAPSPSW